MRRAIETIDRWAADLKRLGEDHRERRQREDAEIIAQRQAENPRLHDPIVYYMRMSDLVKIGTSSHIAARLATINPQGVMAIEFGGYDVEARRHQQFAEHRAHGEWFHLCEEIGTHIAAVRERFRDAAGCTVEEWLAPRLPRRNRFRTNSTPR
jgi:hypothetical protein